MGMLPRRVVPFELFDQQLDARAVVVEAPEVERLQGQIGDQDLIVILAELEERQLLGRLFGLGPSDHDEAIGMRPSGGLVAELGHFDPPAGTHVPQVRQLALDRGRQAGDDHKASLLSLQPLDQGMIVKPFVGADNHPPDSGGNLGEARREQGTCPAGGMGIAGPQLAMPEVLALALETEQGVIRRPAALDRVVADPRPLLFAVDDQHGGVHIEDQPRGQSRRDSHAVKKAIVQGTQLRERGRGHAQQKPPERRGIGIARQAGEVLKYAILPQQLGAFDPFEPEDHRVQKREQHLAHAVTVVPPDETRLLGQQLLEPDATEEAMEQVGTPIVGQ